MPPPRHLRVCLSPPQWHQLAPQRRKPHPPVPTIKITWICSKPRDEAHAGLCERLMIQAAQLRGMDTAEIRHGIHNTTRIKGKCVPDVPHITGNIKDSKTGEGYSLHYYVDLVSLVELPGTPKNPNPRFWKR
ncbi:hypothetical protein BKA83DRAFT_2519814 [Pisolithus microcarpus]|nr:hypothetical protein BKA83DRAFT_2519814 [Pisolithus microcarpus]